MEVLFDRFVLFGDMDGNFQPHSLGHCSVLQKLKATLRLSELRLFFFFFAFVVVFTATCATHQNQIRSEESRLKRILMYPVSNKDQGGSSSHSQGHVFLVFTHGIRRPCWCTKQWQNVVQVLHSNRINFLCSVQHGRRDVT